MIYEGDLGERVFGTSQNAQFTSLDIEVKEIIVVWVNFFVFTKEVIQGDS